MYITKIKILKLSRYHVLESKVIMNEEKVSPPRLFADISVMSNHEIPLWTRTYEWHYVRAEHNECT